MTDIEYENKITEFYKAVIDKAIELGFNIDGALNITCEDRVCNIKLTNTQAETEG